MLKLTVDLMWMVGQDRRVRRGLDCVLAPILAAEADTLMWHHGLHLTV